MQQVGLLVEQRQRVVARHVLDTHDTVRDATRLRARQTKRSSVPNDADRRNSCKQVTYAHDLDVSDFGRVVAVRAAAGLGVRLRDVDHAQLVARHHTT